MRISILCVQGCQFRDLYLNNNVDIGYIDKRKEFLQKKFVFQFHVNPEYYILRSQIRVNFVDFNYLCHWFKTAIVNKQVVLLL